MLLRSHILVEHLFSFSQQWQLPQSWSSLKSVRVTLSRVELRNSFFSAQSDLHSAIVAHESGIPAALIPNTTAIAMPMAITMMTGIQMINDDFTSQHSMNYMTRVILYLFLD